MGRVEGGPGTLPPAPIELEEERTLGGSGHRSRRLQYEDLSAWENAKRGAGSPSPASSINRGWEWVQGMQRGSWLWGKTPTLGKALLARRLLAYSHFGMSQERSALQTRVQTRVQTQARPGPSTPSLWK